MRALLFCLAAADVDGRLRALSPGFEYDDLPRAGIARRKPLPVAANWYV